MAKSPSFNYDHGMHFFLVCPRCQLYYPGSAVGRILPKQRHCGNCGLHIALGREFYGPGSIWMDKDGGWFRYQTALDYHGRKIWWYQRYDREQFDQLYEEMLDKIDPEKIDKFFDLQDYDFYDEPKKFKKFKAELVLDNT